MNNNGHFDDFWDYAIKPSIQNALEEADIHFVDECKLNQKPEKSYKKILDGIYTEKREWLKKIYLPQEQDPVLDMHKLSALICRSIIGNKPIVFNSHKALEFAKKQKEMFCSDTSLSNKEQKRKCTQWFIDNEFINYKIAFDAGVGLAYIDLFHCFQSKDCELKNQLEDMGTLCFYEKSDYHENFRNSMILTLMKNDILNRNFDYLSFATIMFQLQQYTICKLSKAKNDTVIINSEPKTSLKENNNLSVNEDGIAELTTVAAFVGRPIERHKKLISKYYQKK